jgi:hypothetical protein
MDQIKELLELAITESRKVELVLTGFKEDERILFNPYGIVKDLKPVNYNVTDLQVYGYMEKHYATDEQGLNLYFLNRMLIVNVLQDRFIKPQYWENELLRNTNIPEKVAVFKFN